MASGQALTNLTNIKMNAFITKIKIAQSVEKGRILTGILVVSIYKGLRMICGNSFAVNW